MKKILITAPLRQDADVFRAYHIFLSCPRRRCNELW